MDVNVSHSAEHKFDAEEPGGCLWQYCNASEEQEASCYDPRTSIGPITEPARCILFAKVLGPPMRWRMDNTGRDQDHNWLLFAMASLLSKHHSSSLLPFRDFVE